MGAPADVGTHEDLSVEVSLGQLLEGQLQDLEVIGGGVGAGVAGAQDPGQGLAGLGQVTEQWVKAEAAVSSAPRRNTHDIQMRRRSCDGKEAQGVHGG